VLGNAGVSSFCVLHSAFTLLEVMIAMGIFFMAVFSILAVVSNGLRNAALVQRHGVDRELGMLAAMRMATPDKEPEGSESGSFEDIAPGLFPGDEWGDYWQTYVQNGVVFTNLIQHELTVVHPVGGKAVVSGMVILRFEPGLQQKLGFGGGPRR
jgi:hypothetical protein